MTTQKGKDLLVKISDGAGGFTTVASLRTRRLAFKQLDSVLQQLALRMSSMVVAQEGLRLGERQRLDRGGGQ